jgi:hypothetical protein
VRPEAALVAVLLTTQLVGAPPASPEGVDTVWVHLYNGVVAVDAPFAIWVVVHKPPISECSEAADFLVGQK